MPIEPWLREFANLVGRTLARRWLRQSDRVLTAEDDPGRVIREIPEKEEGTPDPARASGGD